MMVSTCPNVLLTLLTHRLLLPAALQGAQDLLAVTKASLADAQVNFIARCLLFVRRLKVTQVHTDVIWSHLVDDA